MLLAVSGLLTALWLLGLAVPHTGPLVHTLLALAVMTLIVHVVARRPRPAT